MMKVMVAINKFVKNNNMLSKVIGNVHDSVVMYIHKNELESIYWKAKEVFEEDIPENKGIPMLMEFDVADYFGKGEVWGFGEEITEQEKGKILADFFEKISKSA
jgi:DNA polymerase I-like protein with 3'-5' exonuclease and polymerase domains